MYKDYIIYTHIHMLSIITVFLTLNILKYCSVSRALLKEMMPCKIIYTVKELSLR